MLSLCYMESRISVISDACLWCFIPNIVISDVQCGLAHLKNDKGEFAPTITCDRQMPIGPTQDITIANFVTFPLFTPFDTFNRWYEGLLVLHSSSHDQLLVHLLEPPNRRFTIRKFLMMHNALLPPIIDYWLMTSSLPCVTPWGGTHVTQICPHRIPENVRSTCHVSFVWPCHDDASRHMAPLGPIVFCHMAPWRREKRTTSP